MNKTLNDIYYMLAQIWIDMDGLSLDAFDNPVFETLAERYGFFCTDYEDARNIQERTRTETCDTVNEIDEQVTPNYGDGWIPVSERLPERNKIVLCWVRSTTIASGETYIVGSCDRGFWFLQTYEIGNEHFPIKDYEVVAWQPLPAPYKSEE